MAGNSVDVMFAMAKRLNIRLAIANITSTINNTIRVILNGD